MTARRGLAAVVLAASVVVLGGRPAAPSPAQDPDGFDLTLVSQTPTVEPGGIFDVRLLLSDATAGTEIIRVVVHDRVRSRSELTSTSDGDGLRRAIHSFDAPVAQLPSDGGGLHLALALDPATDAGRALATPGVYPLELIARGASGTSTARVITHLIVRPPVLETSPPLSVAVLVSIGAPPVEALGPSPLTPDEIARTSALLDTLATGSTLATLAPRPETLEALAAATSSEARALVEQLRLVASRQPLLSLPYVSASPDALGAAGLSGELARQIDHGRDVQREVLGADATESAWLAAPDLGASGLALLDAAGVDRVVVDAARLDQPVDGRLSLARPFLVAPPRERGRAAADRDLLDGFPRDALLTELVEQRGEPAVVASRVLADLAMLWFEQPGIDRAVIVPIDRSLDPSAAARILEGLQVATLFRTVPLDDVFTAAAPLLDAGGDPTARTLEPDGDEEIASGDAARLRELQALRSSVRSMIGDASPLLPPIDAHLLRTLAFGLATDERDVHLDAAREAIDGVTAAVSAQERFTITLTGREGTVPLTIRNDTGGPVDVVVRLRGPRLELPDGDTFRLTLTERITRRDIAVRTRGSGAIPLEVEMTTPDERIVLTAARYSVRSTAVSGVGLVLSAGAGLFLVVWWARHWRQARRSAKLVASPHPVTRSERG